jgi:hypothetical protein
LNEDVFVDENIGVKSESLSRVTEGAILASSLAGLVVTAEGRLAESLTARLTLCGSRVFRTRIDS